MFSLLRRKITNAHDYTQLIYYSEIKNGLILQEKNFMLFLDCEKNIHMQLGGNNLVTL